jgi:predicted GTPase
MILFSLRECLSASLNIARPLTSPAPSSVDCSVMGPTGSGKSAFINLASGSELRVGQSLESCTGQVHHTAPFQIGDRRVVLVDTPGFDDTNKSDTEVLLVISEYLAKSWVLPKISSPVTQIDPSSLDISKA